MTTLFIKNEIYDNLYENVINSVFPSLQYNDKKLLCNSLCHLLDVIAVVNNLTTDVNKKLFIEQITYNNYENCVCLLLLLLPHIKDDIYGTNKKTLKNISDIYISKNKSNIKTESPVYTYSNIQYSRCSRNPIKEIRYTNQFFRDNFVLLLNTVKQISNKLYINWTNIVPAFYENFTNNNIFTSDLYLNTANQIKKHRLDLWDPYKIYELTSKQLYNASALPISNIYEIISNDFYHNIKNIKWTIYDINIIINGSSKLYPIIIILNTIFKSDINDIGFFDALESKINNNNNNNNNNKETSFIKSFENIIFLLETHKDYNDNNIKISYTNLCSIFRSLVIFFNKYYDNINSAIKDNYIKIDVADLLFDADINHEGDVDKILYDNIKNSIFSLPYKHFYNYMNTVFNTFRTTFYGKYLINNNKFHSIYETDKILLHEYISDINNQTNIFITLKNLYNYSKCLCNNFGGHEEVYIAFSRHWNSIDYYMQKKIINRINNNTTLKDDKWFVIKNYINKNYIFYKTNNDTRLNYLIQNSIQNSIYNHICEHITTYIFFAMFYNGTLSFFVPMSNSDNDMKKKNKKKFNQQIFNKDSNYMKYSYYFLTGRQYNNLINYDDYNDNDYKNWFQFSSREAWNLQYTLDWVMQIGFYHKYINNRVLFITGGTGVGKSTQVPKLLLYGLKAFDYKNNGKIVCTQPRRKPTTDSAERISKEMGVPIKLNYELGNNIKIPNYYIQYDHQQDNHLIPYKENIKHVNSLMLKIVTDGKLLIELNDPLMKNKIKDNYLLNNIYDIFIVDEAHEHNLNMDMILTFIKNPLYYNNDIKLVIISATMDNDEFIYRRFYRDVNDNYKYPLNLFNKFKNLDRINVDRRHNIFQPGAPETPYEITEIYRPGADPIELTIEITNKTIDGHILLFEPGQSDIINAVSSINKETSPNIIAIPYYSEMDQQIIDFISNIGTDFGQIKIAKNEPFNDITKIKDSDGKIYNLYNRIIIVATNIAEASITINGLKYVVETGLQKSMIFNYKTNTSILVQSLISELSRKQRKGRVGRRAPGTVYYTYNENAMVNIKPNYKIVTDNIYPTLFSNIIDDVYEPIFDKYNDPYFNNINNYDLDKQFPNNISVSEIIRAQYYYSDFMQHDYKLLKYDYFGNNFHYDYYNKKRPHAMYNGKYNELTLTDSLGNFYIIHPDENLLTRNIIGDIIRPNVDENIIDVSKDDIVYNGSDIISKKMLSYWNSLTNINLINSNKKIVMLSKYGKHFFNIYQYFIKYDQLITIEHIITFIYSIKYNVNEDIIRILSLIKAINGAGIKGGLTGIGLLKNGNYSIEQFYNIYNNNSNDIKSDLLIMLTIINKIHSFLEKKLLINLNFNDTVYIDILKKNKELYQLKNDIDKKNDELYNLYVDEIISNSNKKLIDEYDKILDKPKSYIDGCIFNILNYNSKNIESYCTSLLLNYKSIDKYIKEYILFKKLQYKLLKRDDFIDIMNTIHSYHVYESNPIIGCLLHGYPFNIAIKMGNVLTPDTNINNNYKNKKKIKNNNINNNVFLNIYKPVIENIYTISHISPYNKKNLIIMNDVFIQKYILYINIRADDMTINLLSYVTSDEIANLYKIYSKNSSSCINDNINHIVKINDNNSDIINSVIHLYTDTLKIIKQLCDVNIENTNTNVPSNVLKIFLN